MLEDSKSKSAPDRIFDVDAGLDVLVLPVLAALGGGVTTAWLLLTKVPE